MERTKNNLLIALLSSIGSFVYYYLLCAKSYTWMFASFDSGDWLASSQIWMTPQPYGSPLYVLLGHLINELPVNLIQGMTIGLSVIPASITIGLVFLIIIKMGYEKKIAVLGSLVLLACGIFLSQATVLEEYAIAVMFVTLAFYCYVSGYKKLTLFCLALGTAIHIIVAALTFLWLIVHLREWRVWVKPVMLYVVVVIAFYTFIAWTMWADTPKIIAGEWSLASINSYLGSTSTIGKISLQETPERLLEAVSIILLGFGVCLIPLVWGLRKPWENVHKVMFLSILFCTWLYVTNTDFTTWTFMNFAIPIACVAIAIGLSKMPLWSRKVALGWIACMLVINAIFLNADVLTKQYDEPQRFYEATMNIPRGSAVLCNRGGAHGMVAMYAMASGLDVTPLFLQEEEAWDNRGYTDYLAWVQNHHATEGDNWIEQTEYCLDTSRLVYVPYYTLSPEWQETMNSKFRMLEVDKYYKRIVEVYEFPHPNLN